MSQLSCFDFCVYHQHAFSLLSPLVSQKSIILLFSFLAAAIPYDTNEAKKFVCCLNSIVFYSVYLKNCLPGRGEEGNKEVSLSDVQVRAQCLPSGCTL